MNSDGPGPIPRWLTTAAALSWRLLVVAGGLYVVGLAFARLQVVIVPVTASLFLATILGPPAAWLRRHRVPPLLATWIVFLAAVMVIAAIVVGLIPSISGQFRDLGHELSKGYKDLQHWLVTGPLHLSRQQVDSYVRRAQQELNANRTKIVQGALSGLSLLLEGLAATLLTLVLTFFFVKDGDTMGRWFLDLFEGERAADLRAVWQRAWAVLGGYVRGTAANGAVDALLLSIGLLALGVPLVAPIALLTFVGGFLPLVGAIASGLIAALVALVAKGWAAALIVVGMTVVIHNIEGYLVGPLVLGRAVKLHPVVILISLTVGTIIGGIIGAFLAVPTVAVILAVHEHYRVKRRAPPAEGLLVVESPADLTAAPHPEPAAPPGRLPPGGAVAG